MTTTEEAKMKKVALLPGKYTQITTLSHAHTILVRDPVHTLQTTHILRPILVGVNSVSRRKLSDS